MISESKSNYVKNPYPGIRSFRVEESHLFFGREKQINELLDILNRSNFIAITGASGSGKSSLIKAGLIPALSKQSEKWSSVIFRPGNNLFYNMSVAFIDVFSSLKISDKRLRNQKELENILKEGVEELSKLFNEIGFDKKILLYIDQFEEIFRFRQNEYIAQSKEESDKFVEFLIQASHCKSFHFSVIISLRADFLSDCTEFIHFPDIINEGHYLIPQMTLQEKQRAVLQPARLAGADLSEELIQTLVAHIENQNISLPVLQHALMRTWDYWLLNSEGSNVLELEHYNSIGTVTNALSVHAEQIYGQLANDEMRKVTEKIFKALTYLGDDNRATRRPTSLGDICQITENREPDVIQVIDVFRAEGNSFLFPTENIQLNSSVVIDISHESIMRIWKRLIDWVREETESAQFYLRISKSAELYQSGKTGLLVDPDLLLALKWQKHNKPNQTWAKRYNPAFERTLSYLTFSEQENERVIAVKEKKQQNALKRTRSFVIFLSSASLISILFLVVALNLQYKAEASEKKAKDKEKVAVSESKIAEEKRKEAISQGNIAQQQQFIAEEQKLLAEAQKLFAVTQQNEAIRQKSLAVVAEQEAVRSRDVAVKLKKEAEKLRDQAIEQERQALEQKNRAEISEAKTDTLRRLAIAKALAINAIKVKDSQKELMQISKEEEELPYVLALQAYYFNSQYGGDPNNSDIFNALAEVANLSTHIKGKNAHTDAVRGIAVSNDGTSFVSSSDDGNLKLFNFGNLSSPQVLKNPFIGKIGYRSVIFGGNNLIISGTNKGQIVVWDIANLSEKPVVFNLHSNVISQIISSKSQNTFYSASRDGSVKTWSSDNLISVKTAYKTVEKITAIALNNSDEILVIGTESGNLIYVNTLDFSVKQNINLGKGEISSLCFGDGEKLFVGFSSGKINLLGVNTKEFLAHQSGVTALLYDANSKRLISSSFDGTIKVWNSTDFDLIPPLVITKHDSWVYAIALSPDKKRIISGSADKSILVSSISILDLKNFVRQKVSSNMSQQNWVKFVGGGIDYKQELPK